MTRPAGQVCDHSAQSWTIVDLNEMYCEDCDAILRVQNEVWVSTGRTLPKPPPMGPPPKKPKPEPDIAGSNITKPFVWVRHSALRRLNEDSPFKSWCPVCDKGILLVARVPRSVNLDALDRCTLCGQSFVYEDEEIAGTKVEMPKPSTLEETVAALDEWLSVADKAVVLDNPAITLHQNLGRDIRNRWFLWHDSPLARHMKTVHHIDHPDDMSHKIIENYRQAYRPNRIALINSDSDL